MADALIAMRREQIGSVNGCTVERVVLENSRLSAAILSYGGVIQSLRVKDRAGEVRDVVLGFSSLEDYVDQGYYIGSVIGRCANRISGASFEIGGQTFRLEANEGPNHLHGGSKGFWNVPFEVMDAGEDFVTLRYVSLDGDGGYPGELDTRITFSLSETALRIDYTAVGSRDTVVNLTHHSYFNLEKDHKGNILDETLMLYADAFTEIDDACSSTGRILPVEGTPFDCRKGTRIGDRVFAADDQMKKGTGFNHNYVLSKAQGAFGPVAEVTSSDGLLTMRVESDQPGVQVYSGNYLDGSLTGKNGERYQPFAGLCLETQTYPDAIHFAHFPTPLLPQGKLYQRKTRFSFF